MNEIESRDIDFGVVDFLLKRMTFAGQDFLRLLIQKFGSVTEYQVRIDKVLGGLVKSLEALKRDCVNAHSELDALIVSAKSIKDEFTSLLHQHSLSCESVLRNRKKNKFLKKWVILEIAGDLAAHHDAQKYVGAFCGLILAEKKLAKQIENSILRLLLDGKEFLSENSQRDLARLLNTAHQLYGEKVRSIEDKVRSHYFFKNFYASSKERQSVIDWRSMTTSEFKDATKRIYRDLEQGDPNAIVLGLALILGLPVSLTMEVPLLSKSVDDWVVVIDVHQGLVLFDLDKIFPNGAKPRDRNDCFKPSTNVLVKPLPKLMKILLGKLLLRFPDAMNVKEIVRIEALGTDNQITRLLNTTAKFLINECNMDPFEAALLSGDFRVIATAKSYYRLTTRQKIWDAANHFYEAIDWGASAEIVDGFAFGSMVVVTDEVISEVFFQLAEHAEKIRPTNRCNLERLLLFHDAFCCYSATFAIFCLALRNANPIGLLASDFIKEKRFLVVDDKHVLGSASEMPVAISNSLHNQLILWRLHCATLLKRLENMNYDDNKFLGFLKAIGDSKNSPLFVLSEKPYAASVASIATSWNVPLVENFARHFWESRFNQIGISSRFSGTQLRHQSSGVLSWASDSDLVLSDFIDSISTAQEKVLRDLNIEPLHGLSRA